MANNSIIPGKLPLEWIPKKVLGPTFDIVGTDIAKLYSAGRNKIIKAASRKIKNIEDGSLANLRVVRDIFWNGSFTDEAICAEYFGGILASSRTHDGRDDSGIYYVDIIKSLSSKQLYLHYIIYRCLNKLLISDPEKHKLNVGMENEMRTLEVYFLPKELYILNLMPDIDLEALFRKGLIISYRGDSSYEDLDYVKISPSTLGIHLFSIAYNLFFYWRSFPQKDFGDFDKIKLPACYALSISDLVKNFEFINRKKKTIFKN